MNSDEEEGSPNFLTLDLKERFDRFKIIGETIDPDEQQYNDNMDVSLPGSGQLRELKSQKIYYSIFQVFSADI